MKEKKATRAMTNEETEATRARDERRTQPTNDERTTSKCNAMRKPDGAMKMKELSPRRLSPDYSFRARETKRNFRPNT